MISIELLKIASMLNMQKTSVLFGYPYATPAVDYNAIPYSKRTQTHYPEDKEIIENLVKDMEHKIRKTALEPAYFNMPYAEPTKEFHKIPVEKRTRNHYPEEEEMISDIVDGINNKIHTAGVTVPIWPYLMPALDYGDIPHSARTKNYYPEDKEILDNIVKEMQDKISQ